MPARHHRTREYELALAEEMLVRCYEQETDPDFRRFAVEVFGAEWREQFEELAVALWTASEAGRFCGEAAPRAALGRLVRALTAAGSELGQAVSGAEAEALLLGLIRLAELGQGWQRSPEGWECPPGSADVQFGALARHLLALYPLPTWMDALLQSRAQDGRPLWFLHVAAGGNLRTAPGLPVCLTKKMAHFALESGDGATFVRAVRRGQVLGLGGGEALAAEVGRTWLGRDLAGPAEEAWWSTVLHWLVNHPELPALQVGPLLDYLRHLKRQNPDFSMKGRGVLPLLEGMRGWHRELRRRRRRRRKPVVAPEPGFSSSGLRPGVWRFGRGVRQVTWVLEEILTCRRLFEEGAQQSHCVASYEIVVRAGRTSIWSLQVRAPGHDPARVLTVEVHNESRTIVQARGRSNRWPTEQELGILRLWAQENALRLHL